MFVCPANWGIVSGLRMSPRLESHQSPIARTHHTDGRGIVLRASVIASGRINSSTTLLRSCRRRHAFGDLQSSVFHHRVICLDDLHYRTLAHQWTNQHLVISCPLSVAMPEALTVACAFALESLPSIKDRQPRMFYSQPPKWAWSVGRGRGRGRGRDPSGFYTLLNSTPIL